VWKVLREVSFEVGLEGLGGVGRVADLLRAVQVARPAQEHAPTGVLAEVEEALVRVDGGRQPARQRSGRQHLRAHRPHEAREGGVEFRQMGVDGKGYAPGAHRADRRFQQRGVAVVSRRYDAFHRVVLQDGRLAAGGHVAHEPARVQHGPALDAQPAPEAAPADALVQRCRREVAGGHTVRAQLFGGLAQPPVFFRAAGHGEAAGGAQVEGRAVQFGGDQVAVFAGKVQEATRSLCAVRRAVGLVAAGGALKEEARVAPAGARRRQAGIEQRHVPRGPSAPQPESRRGAHEAAAYHGHVTLERWGAVPPLPEREGHVWVDGRWSMVFAALAAMAS